MATRKLKNFEFAGHKYVENNDSEGLHTFDSFDTPNGYVFVVAGSDRPVEGNWQVSEIISERVKYYLENDQPGDPKEAVGNALVYANGYVYAKAGKEPGFKPGRASVACLLVVEGKVYYAWMGQVSLYLNTEKKRYSLISPTRLEVDGTGDQILFLGQQQMAIPGVGENPLVPVDGDMLLLGTGVGWGGIREKIFCNTLTDSMPTHTKVQQLAKLAFAEQANSPLASFLISFYNLNQSNRSFSEGQAKEAPSIYEKFLQKIESRPGGSILKPVLIALVILIVGYMTYDMFFFNPTKPVTVRTTAPVIDPAAPMADPTEASANETAQVRAAPPANILYTIRRGDTWGRIYQQFEVCSWFITNHPNNSGKFDGAGNPNLNSTITIPLRYSASRRLNPAYFQEFATAIVGNACQKVNEAFKARIDLKLGFEN